MNLRSRCEFFRRKAPRVANLRPRSGKWPPASVGKSKSFTPRKAGLMKSSEQLRCRKRPCGKTDDDVDDASRDGYVRGREFGKEVRVKSHHHDRQARGVRLF